MKTIMFASRHEMTDDQRKDLTRIYGGDCTVLTKNLVWKSIDQIKNVADCYDIVIGVFPQYLANEIAYEAGMSRMAGILGHQLKLKSAQKSAQERAEEGAWTGKILTAVSEPVFAEDGVTRTFKHLHFKNIHGEILQGRYHRYMCDNCGEVELCEYGSDCSCGGCYDMEPPKTSEV